MPPLTTRLHPQAPSSKATPCEFSAHGFSGARVDRIARGARVNTRMLFYYFGDKEALFHTVLESVWKQGDILHEAPDDPMESIRFWNNFYTRNEARVRLLLWEGLELKTPRTRRAAGILECLGGTSAAVGRPG